MFSPNTKGKHSLAIGQQKLDFEVYNLTSFEDKFLKHVTKNGEAFREVPMDALDQMPIVLAKLLTVQYRAELKDLDLSQGEDPSLLPMLALDLDPDKGMPRKEPS
jgi:hypothetical protein